MRFVSQITLSPAAIFSEGKGECFSNLPVVADEKFRVIPDGLDVGM